MLIIGKTGNHFFTCKQKFSIMANSGLITVTQWDRAKVETFISCPFKAVSQNTKHTHHNP